MSNLILGNTPLRTFEGHEEIVRAVAVFPDKRRMVTGSHDKTLRIWDLERGAMLKKMEGHRARSPKGLSKPQDFGIFSVEFSPDDARTWQQVGHQFIPGKATLNGSTPLLLIPLAPLSASASSDNHVRLWRLSDRQTIAIFQLSSNPLCVTFSMDGRHILSRAYDNKISEWAVASSPYSKASFQNFILNSHNPIRASFVQILPITAARDACLIGDLSTAEELLTQDIQTDANDFTSYANRSFVMAQKHAWDHAFEDAIKSISIQPSLTGYISKGIALCGKGLVCEARIAFDVASLFTNKDLVTDHFLLLTKVIALFNADQHEEAMLLIKELAAACPDRDPDAHSVVETYLRLQLGIKAFDGARHDEAVGHFTAAVNSGAFSSKNLHFTYQDLVVAFLLAGKPDKALEAHKYMVDVIDESVKANCLDWSKGKYLVMSPGLSYSPQFDSAFEQECIAFCIANGDAALIASDYDRAIYLYLVVVDLNSASNAVFENRSKAKLGKMLWTEALLDAQKVIELDSSSYIGYHLKHAAFHGARRYDEAIQAFQTMLSKLENASDIQTQKLRQQYHTPSEVEHSIRRFIDAQLDNAPLRVLDTTTGLLCVQDTQISTFKMSTEYKELVSSTIVHVDLQKMGHIKEVVKRYFQYAMLSHRWEGKEPLLQDIQGKDVYDSELDPVGGMTKLRSFCKTARDAGYKWAWNDTCCIDKSNNIELQESVNSMFVWYHHSALTIVYLSDVPPSSKSGALA
ncbi:uncharacterized protein EDB93DRAFT_1272949 [Suillus bovinus]|uniref:uncharacterized protein n=1 Tax=Suillus bovinus TaxID=48563 RepID=UPI001B87F5CE|nr:uncharacterized protein EDB93DRAFT_1272949 [Suillus bovinus]KAG2126787.1 hypothetical protein EDB93DRAFT_1272949 [Suillus bovinus]